jgi:hypothetical protein
MKWPRDSKQIELERLYREGVEWEKTFTPKRPVLIGDNWYWSEEVTVIARVYYQVKPNGIRYFEVYRLPNEKFAHYGKD